MNLKKLGKLVSLALMIISGTAFADFIAYQESFESGDAGYDGTWIDATDIANNAPAGYDGSYVMGLTLVAGDSLENSNSPSLSIDTLDAADIQLDMLIGLPADEVGELRVHSRIEYVDGLGAAAVDNYEGVVDIDGTLAVNNFIGYSRSVNNTNGISEVTDIKIRFRQADTSGNQAQTIYFDNITVTAQGVSAPVPEPATALMLAIGGAGLLFRRRR